MDHRTLSFLSADFQMEFVETLRIITSVLYCFLSGVIQQSPTGISLWMGGHDSVIEGGWEWTDGSPFRYIRWSAGQLKPKYVKSLHLQLKIIILGKNKTNILLKLGLSGNPDDYYGEDCLTILINHGYWNDDNCENKRGYICKRRGGKCLLCCRFLQNNFNMQILIIHVSCFRKYT